MYSLCLDCGATNVRAMVVDEQGAIVGKASQPNATLPGEENPEFHIWDADRIFRQISEFPTGAALLKFRVGIAVWCTLHTGKCLWQTKK